MAEKGWIKLYRKITDSGIWLDKPFDRTHAWIDILLTANHEENKFLLGNEMVKVERGSFITSELKLMERWGWSKSKVRAFLKLLQNEQMIIKKTDHKKTTLSIVNYGTYQDFQTTEEPQKDCEKTAKEPQKDTNNNDKNDKNEKNINIYSSKVFADDSFEVKLVHEFLTLIRVNNPNFKQPNVQKWASDFDKILRIDKRPVEDIRSVMAWAQRDSFWKSNILSPKKLRDKFDTLYMQMNSRGPRQDKPTQQNTPNSWNALNQWDQITGGGKSDTG